MSLFVDLRLAVGSFAERAVELTLPVTCAGCYRLGTTLCRDCGTRLKARLASGSGVAPSLVSALPDPLAQLEWCGPYEGIIRRAIERLSAAGERRLSEPLGTAIANRWSHAGTGGDVLVPVPTSPERVREIGYDHAELLAQVAGRRLGLPVTKALIRPPSTQPPARAIEVAHLSAIAGNWVVLVDDVVVTGTTLATCAAALLAAGARKVSAVTVARDAWGDPQPVRLA